MGRTYAGTLGAFVGTILGLQFGNNLVGTTLSLVVGGVLAWTGYDVPGFIAGVRRAYNQSLAKFWGINFPRVGWAFLYASSVLVRSFVILGVFFSLTGLPWLDLPSNDVLVLEFLFVLLAFMPAVLCYTEAYEDGLSIDDNRLLPSATRRGWMAFLKYVNPVAWTFWVTYGVLWLGWNVLANIPSCVGEVWRFLQLAFAYTHSDDRKLCFLDAVLGAAVGIYYQSPVIGALVGGLIGKLYSPLTRGAAERLLARFEAEKQKT